MDESYTAQDLPPSGLGKPLLNTLPLRLTYIPAHEGSEDLGELDRNHAIVPRFQQLSVLDSWVPASESLYQPKGFPTDLIRTQQSWLLDTYPDAFVGDAAFTDLLSEEIKAAREPLKPRPNATLLSVGEIADVTISGETIGRLAVASASGSSGHVLRLTLLEGDEWTGDDECAYKGLYLLLKNPVPHSHLDWFEDAEPIVSIKFATNIREKEALRWVLVQKASCTTVLQPRLQTYGNSARIVPHRLYSIPRDRTGGGAHCDMSFNPRDETSEQPPQLAIVDDAGNWSVWELPQPDGSQLTAAEPILARCGNIIEGTISRFSDSPRTEGEAHRVMWLAKPAAPTLLKAAWDPELLRSKQPVTHTRSDVLLLCNSRTLDVYNMTTKRLTHSMESILPSRTQRVLQLIPCPLDASHFLMLTTKLFLWVEATISTEGRTALRVLISRPHHMGRGDASLQLSVAAPFGKSRNSVLAALCSDPDDEVLILRLAIAESDGAAQCRAQLVHLDLPVKPLAISLIHVPVTTKRKGVVNELATMLAEKKLSYCQVLALGVDFGVGASLCAWSDIANYDIPPPNQKIETPRERYPRTSPGTFAVPNDFQDDSNRGEEQLAPVVEPPQSKPAKVVRLAYPVAILAQNVRAAMEAEEPRRHIEAASVKDSIRSLVEGDAPAFTLLDVAGGYTSTISDVAHVASNRAKYENSSTKAYTKVHVGEPGAWLPVFRTGSSLSEWTEKLDEIPHSQGVRQTLDYISAQLELAQVHVSVTHDRKASHRADSPTMMRKQALRSAALMSSQLSSSQPVDDQSTESTSQEAAEDPIAARLRRYVPSLKHVTPRVGGAALPIAHWDLGGDLNRVRWKDPEALREEKSVLSRLRKQEGALQKRSRRSLSVFSQQSEAPPTPSPMPFAFSQPQMSITPSQPSTPRRAAKGFEPVHPSFSQHVPGPFGGVRAKSKGPRKSWGFR